MALTPAGARALVEAGHEVMVQAGAGLGSAFLDTEYLAAGARSVGVEEAWDAELVLKVKAPLESEYGYLKDQILFTYLHLAGAPRRLAEALLAKRTSALAYETLEDARGRLPLLAPMSAVAGNIAITVGSYYLARFNGGRGTQLGSVLGTRHGKVVAIGVGWSAGMRRGPPPPWALTLTLAATKSGYPRSDGRSPTASISSPRTPKTSRCILPTPISWSGRYWSRGQGPRV